MTAAATEPAPNPAPPRAGVSPGPRIGPLQLANRFLLAPLAGVSDWPFRLLCRELGAALACTEMVSSHGLVYGGDQTLVYLERPVGERPFAVQIFGADLEILAKGARVAVEHYGPFDVLDLNMGCPVKKVCAGGAGAAMLREPSLVERAVRAVAQAVAPLPVTVKLRAGWDDQSRNATDTAKACEQGGAAAVALHPRTRAQAYKGRADWSLIEQTKRAVQIPVFGSGDLFTAEAALRMLRETGADAARIARGALGHPWIFRELLALERGEPAQPVTVAEWRAAILRHLELATQDKLGRFRIVRPEGAPRPRARRVGDPAGQAPYSADEAERAAVRELRKHLIWYARGRRGGLALRKLAPLVETAADVRAALDRLFPEDGRVPQEVADEPEPVPFTADEG